MISYPRWKMVLVAIVVALAVLLALPNVFGEENALQLVRDRAAVQTSDRDAVDAAPRIEGREADRRIPRPGPPHAALREQAGSAEGARRHHRGASERVHRGLHAGLAGSGVDAQPRIEPVEARPGSARRRVPRLSGRRRGRGEAAARPPRAGLSRLAAQRPRPLSGRGGGLSRQPRARAVPRLGQPRQGQGRHSRGQPRAASHRDHRRRRARPRARAHAAGDQGPAGLCRSAEHRHPAQPPE